MSNIFGHISAQPNQVNANGDNGDNSVPLTLAREAQAPMVEYCGITCPTSIQESGGYWRNFTPWPEDPLCFEPLPEFKTWKQAVDYQRDLFEESGIFRANYFFFKLIFYRRAYKGNSNEARKQNQKLWRIHKKEFSMKMGEIGKILKKLYKPKPKPKPVVHSQAIKNHIAKIQQMTPEQFSAMMDEEKKLMLKQGLKPQMVNKWIVQETKAHMKRMKKWRASGKPLGVW